MEVLFFVLAGIFFCIGGYMAFTHFKKETRSLSDQVSNLQTGKFSTDMNRFAALRQVKSSSKRTELANQLSVETTSVSELGAAQTKVIAAEDNVRNAPDRLQEARQREQADHRNIIAATDEATKLALSVPTYEEIKKKQELDRLDLERRWIEIDQDLKAGFVFAQKEYQYLQMFRQYLNGLYVERKQLEAQTGPARDDQVKLLNKHIRAMEKDFGQQQKRLLQAPAQKNLSTGDEDTESR